MLSELYSATTIMEKEVHRKILSWYARFDLFAGLMSGYETVLGREWFCANEKYFAEQSVRHPDDINYSFEAVIASHRLMAMDMALLFAKFARGNISIQDFTEENDVIASRIMDGKRSLNPWLSDSRHLVQSFEGAPERDTDDIVDPYLPGRMHEGPLWTVNFLFMDWMATDIMHKYQTASMLQQLPPPELTGFALELCRMFEAIEYWPNSLPGSLLAAQATLGIACLFLPKDERHTMWCRRKLAVIESMGYETISNFLQSMCDT